MRHLGASLDDLADHRQVNGHHQVLRRPVVVGLLAQQHFLAPLHHQAQGRLVKAVQRLAGLGRAIQDEPRNGRFQQAALAGESFNDPHQLLLLARGGIGFLSGEECLCIHGFDPPGRWANSTHGLQTRLASGSGSGGSGNNPAGFGYRPDRLARHTAQHSTTRKIRGGPKGPPRLPQSATFITTRPPAGQVSM
ncbi:hypothetical protein D9M72_410640 [compost metagenome]